VDRLAAEPERDAERLRVRAEVELIRHGEGHLADGRDQVRLVNDQQRPREHRHRSGQAPDVQAGGNRQDARRGDAVVIPASALEQIGRREAGRRQQQGAVKGRNERAGLCLWFLAGRQQEAARRDPEQHVGLDQDETDRRLAREIGGPNHRQHDRDEAGRKYGNAGGIERRTGCQDEDFRPPWAPGPPQVQGQPGLQHQRDQHEVMLEGKAVIALHKDGTWAGFCYIETWSHGDFVANSGLIVAPQFRKAGLAKAIKHKIFELSRTKYPNAKLFGLTTGLAVMKINSELGYEPVTYSELTQDEEFWKGCKSCVNYDILTMKERKNCMCTAMLYDPVEKAADAEKQKQENLEKMTKKANLFRRIEAAIKSFGQ